MNRNSSSCPACGSSHSRHVTSFTLSDQFRDYASGREDISSQLAACSDLDFPAYEYQECGGCGLRYSAPMRAPGGDWYSYAYGALGLHAAARWEFDYVLDRLTRTDRIGEIGCGIGIFLDGARRREIAAEGLDFSTESIAECGRRQLAARLVHVDLDDTRVSPDRTAIASFHVLEHLEVPSRLFSLAARWADAGAVLWIAVPSEFGLTRLTSARDPLDEPPHHLTQWTGEALRRLGATHGWHLEQLVHEHMGLRQRLWALCRISRVYHALGGGTARRRWLDRLVRYCLYPWIAVSQRTQLRQLSGFSMLARFRRVPVQR